MLEETNLKQFFSNDTLVKQNVYKAKKSYTPLYINEELYEELFKEKYDLEKANNKISEMFSITLDKNKSEELIGYGYSDKQEDPTGISLSGNEGSGRSFFYGKYFNVKGDKTSLATSKDKAYSNGKFHLSMALRETVISNVLSKELEIPSFETLAILDTNEMFSFSKFGLNQDDEVIEETFSAPCVLEIRVNKDKQLYRVSNVFVNKDKLTYEELKNICDRFALLEAEKYIKRFIHGAWSVGNVSIDANLIDFDTAAFVQGRNPQYSNTNKYKSNYFGYEYLGSKKVLEALYNNALDKKTNSFQELDNYFDTSYKKYLKKYFLELIGLNDSIDSVLIDKLLEKFIKLSKLFLPNYYELCTADKNNRKTYIYDFSRFFRKYLLNRNAIYGVSLLLNDIVAFTYDKVGFIKDKVNEFFPDSIFKENDSYILKEALEFIELYDEIFNKLDIDLKEVAFKQYVNNINKEYLYGDMQTFNKLQQLYIDKKIDSKSLNIIVKYLIKTNINSYSNDKSEYLYDLKLYENYLVYKVLGKNYYYYVLVPYDNSIRFAKLLIGDEEYMFSHTSGTLTSEQIPYDNILDTEKDIHIMINSKIKEKELIKNVENS